MLTKMPKVGDVIIANEKAVEEFRNISIGKEYEVLQSSVGMHGVFADDTGWRTKIMPVHFRLFTVKADANNVGSIEEIEFETTEVNTSDFYAKYHVITLTVDDAGLASVRNLARQSGKQSLRKSIQKKIDALQKELDAL